MEYLKLFIVNGVLGYFLQAIGYVLAIFAFNKRSLQAKKFIIISIIFSTIVFLIRQIGAISFGFHSILIMILFIIISVIFLKTSVYPTVLAVLLGTVMVMVFETINYGMLSLFLDPDTISTIFSTGATITEQIQKALLGLPTNILFIVIMTIIYQIRLKSKFKKG